MDSDEKLEHALRSYRPAGPPAALRAHVLDSAEMTRRIERRVLLIALAAAVVAVVALMLGNETYRELRLSQPVRLDDGRARAEAIEHVVVALGGDADSAREIAVVRVTAEIEAESAARALYGSPVR